MSLSNDTIGAIVASLSTSTILKERLAECPNRIRARSIVRYYSESRGERIPTIADRETILRRLEQVFSIIVLEELED